MKKFGGKEGPNVMVPRDILGMEAYMDCETMRAIKAIRARLRAHGPHTHKLYLNSSSLELLALCVQLNNRLDTPPLQ